MISVRRMITVVGTLVCALGTGFLMQSYLQGQPRDDQGESVQMAAVSGLPEIATDAVAEAEKAPATPGIAEEARLDSVQLTSVPAPPSAAPQPRLLPAEPVTLAALDDQPIDDLPKEEPAPTFACEITLSAQPMAAAMVKLMLEAPCMANERFTLHHNAMVFAEATDAEGRAELAVPALSASAVFIATFATGNSAVATAELGTLEYYDRAVVQWSGPAGLQVHALEYGADYREAGHVWAGAAHDMARAAKGEGGFVVRLGDAGLFNPRMAEVYTFPTGTALKDGAVTLSLEAEVTDANCGKDIEAQSLQKSGTDRMRAREIVLAMPQCEAVGDFLVLKNLFDDLNIARN